MAYFITQPTGVGAGADNEALDDAWLTRPVEIHASIIAGASYLHTLLDKPSDSSATLATPTAQVATITPDVTGTLRVRTRTTTAATPAVVTYVTRVIRVKRDAAGALLNGGICPTAFGELPGEANYGGNARGYIAQHEENWRAIESEAAAGDVYTYAPTLASVKAASGAFLRGVTTGGLLVTPGADNEPVTLTGKNANGTTTKSTALEIGPAGPDQQTPWHFLTSGGVKILAFRRNRVTVGETVLNELEISQSDLVTTTDHMTITGTAFNVQPTGNVEFNGKRRLVMTHGLGWSTDFLEFDTAETGGTHHEVMRCRNRWIGATEWEIENTVASYSLIWQQDASAAGGVMTIRGQRGFAGFVGGDLVIGAGDGGTLGTNAPGVTRIKSGTPVANVGGKIAFEHADGTRWLEAHQSGSGNTQITGGPSGSLTHAVEVKGTYVIADGAIQTILRRGGADRITCGVDGVGLSGNVGFYGAATAAKPTVTGSRGGNAALASLLTGLAALGLITDSSTA